MPSFSISKLTILPGPLRGSAEFLLLSTGPFFKGTLGNVLRTAQTHQKMLSVNLSQNFMYVAGPVGYGLGVLRCLQNLYWKLRHFNCSMPVFLNPYSVLDGGLNNFCFNEELREEYREKVPEEAYAEEAEFRAKHSRKSKEG